MAKPEWGTKRRCTNTSCAAPYYDLNRQPIVCPKCGTTFQPDAVLKPRRARPEEKAAPVPKARAPLPIAEAEEEGEVKPDEEELIEDPSELGEDKDDVAEVVDDGDAAEER
jgi:uncharacterized protein (TIGR02300 family)